MPSLPNQTPLSLPRTQHYRPRRASLTGMATQANRPDRIERRRQSAKDRHTAREALTAAEQIRRLDDHLGAGVGATKERARLAS